MANSTADRILDSTREAGKDGVSVQQLVETLGVAKSGITRGTNKLIEQNLVRRTGDQVFPVLRRGRRLISTEERDQHALKLIHDAEHGLSVIELAELQGITRGLAYQSIYRLRESGQIYRQGVTRTAKWYVVEQKQAA